MCAEVAKFNAISDGTQFNVGWMRESWLIVIVGVSLIELIEYMSLTTIHEMDSTWCSTDQGTDIRYPLFVFVIIRA